MNAICKTCGYVFQKQFFNRDFYQSLPCHFPTDYEDHALRRGRYIVDFLPPEEKKNIHRFLDVGCGEGAVMKSIQDLLPGSESWGCTLGKSAINIMKGDIETACFPWRNFDFIVLCHVVEHFLIPIDTLYRISTYLSNSGIVYIEVPSFHWVELRLPSVWTPEHMSYFTPQTLKNTLSMAGLTPIKMKESKYWGNIKVVCKKTEPSINSIKKVDYRNVLCYHSLVKLSYPWYKLMRNIKTIGTND